MIFKLPSLSYGYDELEPFIDKETMEIHYTKHHQVYINNANSILNDLPDFINLTVDALIQNLNEIPKEKRTILRNNAGGHANHILFWKGIKKNTTLKGELRQAIEYNFGSFCSFKDSFEKIAVTHFGSGWAWLIKKNNELSIITTKNQDNPLMSENITNGISGYPILGLDLWEHAYYLKYQNRRIDYIKSFWNIINWEEASIRFLQ